MNQYVTGAVIKELREKNHITQLQLAEKLGVSDKTISKWETGKGERISGYYLVRTYCRCTFGFRHRADFGKHGL